MQETAMIIALLFIGFILLVYAGVVLGTVLLLRRLKIGARSSILAGFVLLGILLGLWSALSNYSEGVYLFNMPGMWLGDSICRFAINHFGDPHSFYAHYTIPWLLRTPQVHIPASMLAWGLLGLVVQIIYNLVKKPPVVFAPKSLVTVIALFVCLGVSIGAVYFTQDAEHKNGPTEPNAVSVIRISLPPLTPGAPPSPTLLQPTGGITINTYNVESLSLSDSTLTLGKSLEVTGNIKNTGTVEGTAGIQLVINGKVLNTQQVFLLPGEIKAVEFIVNFPREGVYQVKLGDLTADCEVIK
jgi:hypothetical protein